MNKIFNVSFLMVCFVTFSYSQSENKNPNISELRKNNYQVELNFKTVQNIYSNTAAATLMFKKKYNPGELIDITSIKFLRTYLTLNSNINLGNDTFPNKHFMLNYKEMINLTFGLGIEKQFQNRKFVHYLGCDIFTNYYDGSKIINYYYTNSFMGYNMNYEYEKTINSGLIPFIGLKYYVTDQLSFGIETGLSLSYYSSKINNVYYSLDFVNGKEVYNKTELTPFIENGIKFNYLGLRFITIGYSFK